ncbi:hypothetical protein [Synechococcus sp. RedBA-s]|uniref:hypothetical protein n=1 Tax=Synechococcus sp. RedBA-s TaxID=2823741 RepID=UPI0020CC44AA|nr:hypothetical protein [Synechococcus sp. RedBA-s]MCP9801907.1 hypothetical protein [Synechococcus sp. RedBA-s]
MPKIGIAATHLDLISFKKAIRGKRMQGGIRIAAWYLLLVAVLDILSHALLYAFAGRTSPFLSDQP